MTKADRIKPGSWCWLMFYKWEDVLFWPPVNPATGTITEQIILKNDAIFLWIRPSEQDRFFREELKYDGAGPYYEDIVNCKLPGGSISHILTLAVLPYHQFGILLLDRNGEKRLIGNKDAGARLFWKYDTGTLDGSRGREIQWKFESALPAPIYDNPLPTFQYGLLTEEGDPILTDNDQQIIA